MQTSEISPRPFEFILGRLPLKGSPLGFASVAEIITSKRNAGRPGEAEGEIHSLVGHRTSKSEHDLRGPGESDGRPVVGRDLAVAVQVEVFDVARPHLGHEGLRGAVGDLLFAGEEAERDVAEWLVDPAAAGFRASRNADAAYRPRRCGCAHR